MTEMVQQPRAARWDKTSRHHSRLEEISVDLEPLHQRLVAHPIYRTVDSVTGLRRFMEHHVFAVLDFMWMLKGLQRHLTCVDVPWMPKGSAATRRFVNEIVLEEESDVHGDGWTSHFELYLTAMAQAGADCSGIEGFMSRLQSGMLPLAALQGDDVPWPARGFVERTWRLVSSGHVHELAAAFAFGRENLIPTMFSAVTAVAGRLPIRVDRFVDYLERHTQLDGEVHAPIAFKMLCELCGDDDTRWYEAREAVRDSLRSRIALWDAVAALAES